MSQLNVSLPLTSIILGCNLLGLPPVWAQANHTNTTVPEIKTTAKLPEKNEAADRVIRLAETSGAIASTDESEIHAINESLHPLSVTTFNSNNINEASQDFSVSNIELSNIPPPSFEKQEEGDILPVLSGNEAEEVKGDRALSQNDGEESLTNSNVVPSTVENQVFSDNRFPSIASDVRPQLPEITTNELQSAELYSQPPDSLEEVTSVEELRDVSPGDWAYEALRSLVEKYRCIAGSGKGIFR